MRLDLNGLSVESFSTVDPVEPSDPVDTGPQGPDSLCWICYPTGNTVPTCNLCTIVYPCPLPDTYFAPCPPRTIAVA